jgi:alkylation response protein AidB-like acyl-CoA dehydrogenase
VIAATSMQSVLEKVRQLSAAFTEERSQRQHRLQLDPFDFERLRAAGFPLTAVPEEFGGLWAGVEASTRPICEMLRSLAHGDSSVALVAAMHPTVLWDFGWLSDVKPPPAYRNAWNAQRREVFTSTAVQSAFWGNIFSEPGGDGEGRSPRTIAKRVGDHYELSGLKHLGTGLGIVSYMSTVALPEGELEPDTFFVDLRGVPWDGSRGARVVGLWDGHGMVATQSHTVSFEGFPAQRTAWPRNQGALRRLRASPIACFWAAVVLGIVEVAVDAAREHLQSRRATMGAFDRVEWSRVELEAWLVEQAYEGMLRAVTGDGQAQAVTLRGKVAIAELAELALSRLCRVVGGASYSRSSPFGWWHQDVRVLGFLRPRWGIAYEALIDLAWENGIRS